MKKFLCYDTNDAASGKINVDSRGMLTPPGGVKTAIIRSSSYDDRNSSNLYTCTNMTFEEAYQTMMNADPLGVFGMFLIEDMPVNMYGVIARYNLGTGHYCISIAFNILGEGKPIVLYWTADGISDKSPVQ